MLHKLKAKLSNLSVNKPSSHPTAMDSVKIKSEPFQQDGSADQLPSNAYADTVPGNTVPGNPQPMNTTVISENGKPIKHQVSRAFTNNVLAQHKNSIFNSSKYEGLNKLQQVQFVWELNKTITGPYIPTITSRRLNTCSLLLVYVAK